MVQQIKIFPQDTPMSAMQSIDSEQGFYLNDVINNAQYESYVEETLYTSLNNIRFFYPSTGGNVQYIKNGSHVLYPTPTGYNLYTIDRITITTDDSILQVDAQHYSVNYMRDSAHEVALGQNARSISSINQTLKNSQFVSDDFELAGEGLASDRYTLTDDTIITSFQNATVGSVLVGANSLLRRFYGMYLRRNLSNIEAFNVSEVYAEMQQYPIVLGVNIRDMDYTIDTSDILTTAMVSTSSVPQIYINKARIGGTLGGFGGTKLQDISDLPLNHEIHFIYKGIPIIMAHTTGGILVSAGNLRSQNDAQKEIKPFKDATFTYIGGVLNIKKGEITFLNELIDPDYAYAYGYYDRSGGDVFKEYMGFRDETVVNDTIKYSKIEPYMFQYPVRANTQIKGNAVKYVDYEVFEIKDRPDADLNITSFYRWYFNDFKNYWDVSDNLKYLEPTFEAKFTVDDMRTLYGQDTLNSHIFKVGDVYPVIADEYGLEFNAAITRTKYNGLTGDLIEIEFGNKQDLQIEEFKVTNTNKPNEVKRPTNTDNNNSNNSSSGGGGNNNTNPDDEDTPDLSMDINDLTDDGPERIEWENPVLYIAPKSTRTSQLKLNWYNRSREVALPKLVDFYKVKVRAVGSNDWNYLEPDPLYKGRPNTDRILPYMPKPAKSTVSGNWFNYKVLYNLTGISNDYDLPQSYYNNSALSKQMTYEEWLNIYKVDDYSGRWYFFYEHIDGAFINRYDLKEIHNILFDTVYDDQLAPFIRLIYPDEFEGIKSDILGKTVKELYEESEGYTNDPIDKNYLIKRLKYVVAASAERAIRYNLDGVDYRKVDSQEPSVPPVKVNHSMYVKRTAILGTYRNFRSECEISFIPRIDPYGKVGDHRPASDLSTVKITKLFHDSEPVIKYAHNNFIEPGGAIYARLEIPQYPDLPVEPVIVVAHGTIGMEIRSKINELNKLYATLSDDDRKRFEAQHGTYASNYYKALVDEGLITYGQSIVIKPEDLVEHYDRVHVQMDRYWEKVYSELISKGKINADTIYEETE